MKFIFLIFAFFVIAIHDARCLYRHTEKFELGMPNVKPSRPNLYLCTPVKVDPDTSFYFVGFEPNASMSVVHHMILYGCSTPGRAASVWNCGEMSSASSEEDTASPCLTGMTILYAWARDAPKLELPEDVAFKVGKNTDIKYLVLQIHYGHVEKFQTGLTDSSGLFLYYTEIPLPKLAGVLLMGTGGRIMPRTTESMETSCSIEEDKEIHPFRFRTHTHELGVRVAGYRVRKIGEVEHWTLIGEHDPLKPQMFYPVNDDIVLRKGDVVAASCKMDASSRDEITLIGPTGEDEMCNFYMMYWVEDSEPLKQHYCFSMGPPNFYWRYLYNNIPVDELKTYRRERE